MTGAARVCAIVCTALLAGQPGRAEGHPAEPLTRQAARPDLAPAAVLRQINALLGRDDLAGARAALATALADHPRDPALHNLAGVLDAEDRAFASAESHFRTAIQLGPREAAPYENLGRLYQEQSAADPGARAKALEVYGRLLAVQPSNAEALYQSGFLLALDGAFAASRPLVERLPAEVRRQAHVQVLLALDLAGAGDTAGTATAVRALAADPQLSAPDILAVIPAFDHLPSDELPEQLLKELDRRDLATTESLQALGRIYVRRGQQREARAVFERAAALGGARVPVLIDLARAADKLGDHDGALGYLAHARDLEPSNATVHFLFGIVCVELNLGSEAYESLKKAVALAPENALVNYAMGAVSMFRHEPSESLPFFEKYLALAPDDPRGRFALGVARFHSGQFDAAAADLREAVRHPPTAAGAHYFLGRIARQANDLETARREVDAALAIYPAYAEAWSELGLIQTRSGAYAEAGRSLAKAVELDPDNYSAAVNLAMLYGRTKDPRQDAQTGRLKVLQDKRAAQAQEFLRIIEVVR